MTVFVYHDVTATPSEFQRLNGYWTSPASFDGQVAWIKERFSVIDPSDLPQLGGGQKLPDDAALLTFDDAWAGVFRVAVPSLESAGVPALCFVNMATVTGDPDLAAVRRYERTYPPAGGSLLKGGLDLNAGNEVLRQVRERYGDNEAFALFQGETATPQDLAGTAARSGIWLASHLYHHWDVGLIEADLFEDAMRSDLEALLRYENRLPLLATPYGADSHAGDSGFSLARRMGHRAAFIATGRQNAEQDGYVIDRVSLPGEGSAREWWYETHRGRLLGGLGISLAS